MDITSYLLGRNVSGGTGGGVTIDSGSNENGFYIKFSNGDVIQYGIIIVESGHTYADLTFPVEFNDTDYTIISNAFFSGSSYGGSGAITTFTAVEKNGKTGCYVYSWNKSGDTALNFNRKVSWLAIGKWK